MRLLTYLVGCSVDGFTAGPDGQCDPFGLDGDLKAAVLAEYPETVPDHARRSLGVVSTANRLFDTVVMRRGVYESARAAGADSPYPWMRQYVVSSPLKRPPVRRRCRRRGPGRVRTRAEATAGHGRLAVRRPGAGRAFAA